MGELSVIFYVILCLNIVKTQKILEIDKKIW